MQKSSAEIESLIAETVTGLGFEFVEFERLSRGLLRVSIDSEKDGGIAVDDCERVSDQLTRLFTVEDIDFDRLEVSSPGVDRPLKRLSEWRRFVGRVAHVELYEPLHAEGLPEGNSMGRSSLSLKRMMLLVSPSKKFISHVRPRRPLVQRKLRGKPSKLKNRFRCVSRLRTWTVPT